MLTTIPVKRHWLIGMKLCSTDLEQLISAKQHYTNNGLLLINEHADVAKYMFVRNMTSTTN